MPEPARVCPRVRADTRETDESAADKVQRAGVFGDPGAPHTLCEAEAAEAYEEDLN